MEQTIKMSLFICSLCFHCSGSHSFLINQPLFYVPRVKKKKEKFLQYFKLNESLTNIMFNVGFENAEQEKAL